MARDHWTDDEYEIVRSAWPDVEKIARLLPHRTPKAIREAASRCDLRRPLHIWTADQDLKLRRLARSGLPRQAIAKELGLGRMQVQNRMNYAGIKSGRQAYKRSGDEITDQIKQRVYVMNMTLAELDAACGTGEHFQRCGKRGVAYKYLRKALKVLGGELVIRWQPLSE